MRSTIISELPILFVLSLQLGFCLSTEQRQQAAQSCDTSEQQHCQSSDIATRRSNLIVYKDAQVDIRPKAAEDRSGRGQNCFRAAVVDYSRVEAPNDCQTGVEKNLDVFEKIAKIAHENHVQMLVFPEDGLFMDSREAIAKCLETIPDPESLHRDHNDPCFSSSPKFKRTPILTRLSCIAKRYGLYLVANYGTKMNCVNSTEAEEGDIVCPNAERTYLMLNTDVVFDPMGRFIKRYRKWNPFTLTEIFNKAPRLEHTFFDTEFGRFGVFTCFDMIYKEPALDLVEQYNIDTAIFPTWWFDELPVLSAIQYQDGWSETNRVNLLASNILKLSRGSTGSSIFSNNNSLYVSQNHYADGLNEHKTKLLIANLQSKPRDSLQVCDKAFEPQVIEIDDNPTDEQYKYYNFSMIPSDSFKILDKKQDKIKLCSNGFCCSLDYKLSDTIKSEDIKRVIFFVRNGLRPPFEWYEQICSLATLESLPEGDPITERALHFDFHGGVDLEEVSISAAFDTKYVYPSTAFEKLQLIDRNERNFNCKRGQNDTLHNCQLHYKSGSSNSNLPPKKIYSFSMFARIYEKDKKTE